MFLSFFWKVCRLFLSAPVSTPQQKQNYRETFRIHKLDSKTLHFLISISILFLITETYSYFIIVHGLSSRNTFRCYEPFYLRNLKKSPSSSRHEVTDFLQQALPQCPNLTIVILVISLVGQIHEKHAETSRDCEVDVVNFFSIKQKITQANFVSMGTK